MTSFPASFGSVLPAASAAALLGSAALLLTPLANHHRCAPSSPVVAEAAPPAAAWSWGSQPPTLGPVLASSAPRWLAATAAALCLSAAGAAARRRGSGAAVEKVLDAAADVGDAGAVEKEAAARRRKEQEGAYGASHTSIYTEEVAKERYDMLEEVLAQKLEDVSLRNLTCHLLNTCEHIADALRVNLVTVHGVAANTFGDTQLSVDLIADKLLWDMARSSPLVCEAASEELPEMVAMNPEGSYVLCWDPLDGSSIVDNNWSVGTIVGVWHRSTGLLGATGGDQVMSLVAMYGPRTTAFVTLDDGVYEFTLVARRRWICSRERICISRESKIFAPANLRSTQEVPGYQQLIDYYMTQRYTLRYTGGLVPDVCQQFTKLQGIFTNPTSKASPAKLRLAFEAAPFGRLVELAGGKTSDGATGRSVLDVPIESVDQRTALAIGSALEVERFNTLVLGTVAAA